MKSIKPYSIKDKSSLLQIFKRNVPANFAEEELGDFDVFLDAHHNTYLTVWVDDTIAGGAGYIFAEEYTVGRIAWILFDPDTIGKGLGSELVHHCIKLIKGNQLVKKIEVNTSQMAHSFFLKLGFTLVYSEKNYWSEGFDLYAMELVL